MGRSPSVARLKAELLHPGLAKARQEIEELKRKVTRRSSEIPDQVNTALLQQMQAQSGGTTFVLDTNLACIFKTLDTAKSTSSCHRKIFLDFLLSVNLGAPPAVWREYAAFGPACSIPFSRLSKQDGESLELVADDLLRLSWRKYRRLQGLDRDEGSSTSSSRRRLAMDYRIVLQSALLYPKTTILTNDWDLWFFRLMSQDIEDLLCRRYPTICGLSLHSVSLVNVATDLGLRLR